MPKIKRKTYILVVSALSFIFLIVLCGAYFKNMIYSPASKTSSEVRFTVEKGQGSMEIAKSLEEKGLIKNDIIFVLYLRFKNKLSSIQAGDYVLNKSYSMIDTMQILTKGEVITDKITIPEGWTNKMIKEELIQRRHMTTEAEFEKAINKKYDYDFLKLAPVYDLQGFIFPDTYLLSSRPTAEEVIDKALIEFSKKVDPKIKQSLATNKNQKLTYYEILTLASIVEREVRTKEDRKRAAGIFLNRLAVDMPLQSDATLQYILNSNKRIFSYEETRVDSPYNTYQNRGLPPGPIANPGLMAIEAVLDPEETDYLYFLSGKDGKTYFSKTLEEHERKKELYL